MRHLSAEELEAGLALITQSPRERGRLEMIVRRPRVEEREVVAEGELDVVQGLVGDTWPARRSTRTSDDAKFVSRFGVDAMKFVNSEVGRRHNLRGINARVVQPGTVRVGDVAHRLT